MAGARFSEDRMAELRCCDGVGRAIHVWEPARPRGVMLAIHGGLAHAGDWVTPALHFKERGWATVGFDMHGHDGQVQAHVPRFQVFLDDVELFLAWVKAHYPGLPIVFLTHSMGGLIAAHYVLARLPQGDPAVKGYVMSSPYLANAVKVPKLLMMISGPMAAVLPRMSVPMEDLVPFLTHDQAITERHRRDEQDHIRATRASARFGNELLKAQSYVAANIARWNQPLFLVTAGEDRLADLAVTNHLVSQIDPRYVERHHYPGNYHENFNELNRAEIFGNIELWMTRRLGLTVG